MSTFSVLQTNQGIPKIQTSQALLAQSSWDDWFTYSTAYDLWIWSNDKNEYEHMGSLKIGRVGMGTERFPEIPESFDKLDSNFFSVGMNEGYYENLERRKVRLYALERLNDIAFSSEAFTLAEQEQVTRSSLLRDISAETVLSEFRRIARGGTIRTKYHFEYHPLSDKLPKLKFDVDPEAYPPNNIHIFIGRNGVGKTSFLRLITRAILGDPECGKVISDDRSSNKFITSIVSVSFSAFDRFPAERSIDGSPISYEYVGLKKTLPIQDKDLNVAEEIFSLAPSKIASAAPPLKNHEELTIDFLEGLNACMMGVKRDRWRAAVRKLYSDPIFQEAEIEELSRADAEELNNQARSIFTRLSSGHQIVLYTITKLVQLVGDRVLVLIDEPECHLHPPLLSAFTRALSEMLTTRNAVGIIATHSPVILQEVPSESVYIFNRSGQQVTADRPTRECFGENVGVLTHEIFGLEVKESGFHQLIREQAHQLADYDTVLKKFGNKLGGEALALTQVLVSRRQKELIEQ